MDTALAILVGIGLAASCGFRVFVPLLVVSAAAYGEYLTPASGFAWLGSWPALVGFSVAAVIEVGAYYIPWLDNTLDVIASPLAAIAGAVLFAASVTELDPFMQWSMAIIAGGGAASVVQGGTVLTRLASTASTGGLANFVVTTVETAVGFLTSILAIVVPVLAIVFLLAAVAIMYVIGRPVLRSLRRGREAGV